ncbi:unnamed protein product, partial [Didymodactylos carnosus]
CGKSYHVSKIIKACNKANSFIEQREAQLKRHQQSRPNDDLQFASSCSLSRSKSKRNASETERKKPKQSTALIQYITLPELMSSLEKESAFIIGHEGDALLKDMSFYDPKNGDKAHGTFTEGFDDFDNTSKATLNYGLEIMDKTISILIASTGKNWPDLLAYHSTREEAGNPFWGFYERFLLYVMEKQKPTDPPNTGTEEQIKEKIQQRAQQRREKRESRKKTAPFDRTKPSLAQLFLARKAINRRYYELETEADAYIVPIIEDLLNDKGNSNILDENEKPQSFLPENVKSVTGQDEALAHRAADILLRVSCNVQQIEDALSVFHNPQMSGTFTYDVISDAFYDRILQVVDTMFGEASPPFDKIDATVEPDSALNISLASAQTAVNFVGQVLLPQQFAMHSYQTTEEETTQQQLYNEKSILFLPFKFFNKTLLTGHNGILRKLASDEVEKLLNRLVSKQLLLRNTGTNDKFFKHPKQNNIPFTYAKYIPNAHEEAAYNHIFVTDYQSTLAVYKQTYRASEYLPKQYYLTPFGMEQLERHVCKELCVGFNVFTRDNEAKIGQAVPKISKRQITTACCSADESHDSIELTGKFSLSREEQEGLHFDNIHQLFDELPHVEIKTSVPRYADLEKGVLSEQAAARINDPLDAKTTFLCRQILLFDSIILTNDTIVDLAQLDENLAQKAINSLKLRKLLKEGSYLSINIVAYIKEIPSDLADEISKSLFYTKLDEWPFSLKAYLATCKITVQYLSLLSEEGKQLLSSRQYSHLKLT